LIEEQLEMALPALTEVFSVSGDSDNAPRSPPLGSMIREGESEVAVASTGRSVENEEAHAKEPPRQSNGEEEKPSLTDTGEPPNVSRHDDKAAPEADLDRPKDQDHSSLEESSTTIESALQEPPPTVNRNSTRTPEMDAPGSSLSVHQEPEKYRPIFAAETTGPARMSFSRVPLSSTGYVSEGAETHDSMTDDIGDNYFEANTKNEIEQTAHYEGEFSTRDGNLESTSATKNAASEGSEHSGTYDAQSDEDRPQTPRPMGRTSHEAREDSIHSLEALAADEAGEGDHAYQEDVPGKDVFGQNPLEAERSVDSESREPNAETRVHDFEPGPPDPSVPGHQAHQSPVSLEVSTGIEDGISRPDSEVLQCEEGAEEESEVDDTDIESQRFVTPFSAHPSLKQHNETPVHSMDVDDYVGPGYHVQEENADKQSSLFSQHSTTVQGEADLFEDDTDRSEGPDTHAEATEKTGPQEPDSAGIISDSPRSSKDGSIIHIQDDSDQNAPGQTGEELELPESLARSQSVVTEGWEEQQVEAYFTDESRPDSRTQSLSAIERARSEETQNNNPRAHHHDSFAQADDTKALGAPRPETPTGSTSVGPSEHATPETLGSQRVANALHQGDTDWTPGSDRTRATLPSSPPSPTQAVLQTQLSPTSPQTGYATTVRSPMYYQTRRPVNAQFTAVCYDDTEVSTTPVSLLAPWEGRKSPELTLSPRPSSNSSRFDNSSNIPVTAAATSSSSSSLFKRMRSIFEHPNADNAATISNRTSPTTGHLGWQSRHSGSGQNSQEDKQQGWQQK
jgi:hypothetical protein